jgi:hypothetical protein
LSAEQRRRGDWSYARRSGKNIDSPSAVHYDANVKKEMRRILWQLRGVKNLSVEEKLLFARSLAATPDERWRLHENYLRSLGLFTRSSRKAFGFK